jgi:hypothetical protein
VEQIYSFLEEDEFRLEMELHKKALKEQGHRITTTKKI